MKKLWIVTELFYPDETATAYILTNIANNLTKKYDVNVICGPIANHVPSITNLFNNIKIYRTNKFNLNKNNFLMRVVRLFFIGLILSFKLLRYSRKDDKVLIVTNPVSLVVLVSLVKTIKKFELSILVHDVFPENAVSAGIMKKGSLIYKSLKYLFDCSYASADKLIVLGRDMEEIMRRKMSGHKGRRDVGIITNWADIDLVSVNETLEHPKVVIQYAGNIGRVQGLKEFLRHLANSNNKDLLFSLWGNGALVNDLKSEACALHLETVEFNGSFTRADQNEIIRHCDISLVTLGEGMYGLGVPSKSYNIMAAGKPILYIGPKGSEIFQEVSENGIGYAFEASDYKGIEDFLRSLIPGQKKELKERGLKARSLAVSKYTKERILNKFTEFV